VRQARPREIRGLLEGEVGRGSRNPKGIRTVMKKTIAMLAAAAALALVAAPSASAGDIMCTGTLSGTLADNVLVPGGVPSGASCRLLNATVTGNVKALQNSRLYINGTDVDQNVIGDKADVVQLVGNTTVGAVPADANRVRENIEIKDGDNSAAGGSTNVAVCSTRVEVGNVHVEKMGTSASPTRILVGGPDIVPPPTPTTSGVTDTGPPGPAGQTPLHNCGNPGTPPGPNNLIERGNVFLQENFVAAQAPFLNGLGVYSNGTAATPVHGNLQVFKNRGPGQLKEVQGNNVRENIQCKENDPPFTGAPNSAGGSNECVPGT
jgi:hypothetical protein